MPWKTNVKPFPENVCVPVDAKADPGTFVHVKFSVTPLPAVGVHTRPWSSVNTQVSLSKPATVLVGAVAILMVCGIVHDLRRGQAIVLADRLEFTTARREHVLHPFRLAAVGQGDDEPMGRSKDVHRSSVDLPRLAPHMREDAEPRQPARKQTGNSVCENNIDLREPSLPKPHHRNAWGGDGDDDDYDGGVVHGNCALFRDMKLELHHA